MKNFQKVNGITANVEIEKNAKRNHLRTFQNIEKMVEYMVNNDVIHKGANIGNDFYVISLEKTDEANENWYENEMRISKNTPELPTNMWK
jgi:hypothetical protein